MLITIKNMVRQGCETIVKNILASVGLEAADITDEQVLLKGRVLQFQLRLLDKALQNTGLEIVIDKKGLLTQKVKNIIHEIVYYDEAPLTMKLSCYLSQRLNYSYTYLANIFSQQNGITLERYIILQKVEKVKAMLAEEDCILSKIAFKMNYKSVSHLSAQFKKVTGITPGEYRSLQEQEGMHLVA